MCSRSPLAVARMSVLSDTWSPTPWPGTISSSAAWSLPISVNPLPVTREAWRGVAAEHGVEAIEIEVVCSDASEHRRRVETRDIDIEGFAGPSWAGVTGRDYRPWPEADLSIETAGRPVEACLAELLAFLDARGVHPTQ